MRMLREAWAESNPAHCNERREGKTRRGDTEHGFCVNRGLSWNRIMSGNKGWNQRWKARRGWCRGRVQVRQGKNSRQGASLDKDQRQNKQYNYEQARSTRHASRPADWHEINGHPQESCVTAADGCPCDSTWEKRCSMSDGGDGSSSVDPARCDAKIRDDSMAAFVIIIKDL